MQPTIHQPIKRRYHLQQVTSGFQEQEAQLSQKGRTVLRVIEYFAKSLNHPK